MHGREDRGFLCGISSVFLRSHFGHSCATFHRSSDRDVSLRLSISKTAQHRHLLDRVHTQNTRLCQNGPHREQLNTQKKIHFSILKQRDISTNFFTSFLHRPMSWYIDHLWRARFPLIIVQKYIIYGFIPNSWIFFCAKNG